MKQPVFLTSTMDVLTAIESRRSIRAYTPEPVSEQALNTILYAGLCAPTARNRRPFHFVVVQDPCTLTELSKAKQHAEMLQSSPCAIVVCGDAEIEEREEFLHANCFAATQNILLCIHALGLGAVWCGVGMDSNLAEALQNKLELPPGMKPLALIALGHPAEEKPQPNTWDPAKIHREKW